MCKYNFKISKKLYSRAKYHIQINTALDIVTDHCSNATNINAFPCILNTIFLY